MLYGRTRRNNYRRCNKKHDNKFFIGTSWGLDKYLEEFTTDTETFNLHETFKNNTKSLNSELVEVEKRWRLERLPFNQIRHDFAHAYVKNIGEGFTCTSRTHNRYPCFIHGDTWELSDCYLIEMKHGFSTEFIPKENNAMYFQSVLRYDLLCISRLNGYVNRKQAHGILKKLNSLANYDFSIIF